MRHFSLSWSAELPAEARLLFGHYLEKPGNWQETCHGIRLIPPSRTRLSAYIRR